VTEQSGRQAAVEALVLTPPEELMERMVELRAAAEEAGLTGKEVAEVLNARPDLPRPLLQSERDMLAAVLGHRDFPGRDQLLAQLDSTYVDSYCGCGCAAVTLQVQGDVPPAGCETSTPAETAIIVDEDGDTIGLITLIVSGGYLRNVELTWFDAPICPFPPPDRLRWEE
jgi:hypothetical protein